MKYFLTVLLGVVVGVCLAAAMVFYNPLTKESLSPLSVSVDQQFSLNFSTAADEAIAVTNNGELSTEPKPAKISELWEAPIRQSEVLVTRLYDSRGNPIGVGIKYSSLSEDTNPLRGKVIVDSAWHILLPARGTLMVGQTENYWGYLRDIVVPAHRSSADSWKGRWHGTLSNGPGALGTANVYGGSGRFRDLDSEAIETLVASAYSAKHGPVAVDGQLLIDVPVANDVVADSGDQ